MKLQKPPDTFPRRGSEYSLTFHRSEGIEYVVQDSFTGDLYAGGGFLNGYKIEDDADIGCADDSKQSQKSLNALVSAIRNSLNLGESVEPSLYPLSATDPWTLLGYTIASRRCSQL